MARLARRNKLLDTPENEVVVKNEDNNEDDINSLSAGSISLPEQFDPNEKEDLIKGITSVTTQDKKLPSIVMLQRLEQRLDALQIWLKDVAQNDEDIIEELNRIKKTKLEAQKDETQLSVEPEKIKSGDNEKPLIVNKDNEKQEESNVQEERKEEEIEIEKNADTTVLDSQTIAEDTTKVKEEENIGPNLDLHEKRPRDEDNESNESNKREKLVTTASDIQTEAIIPEVGISEERLPTPEEIESRENDPNVKNPKSEFVVSQTLPAAATALGLFNESQLTSTGDDYLKQKYAVASYPTTDLKDQLPGPIPDGDFTNPKPTNQIQFTTFLSSIDNFFKEFTNDDINFLNEKYVLPSEIKNDKDNDPESSPYLIPKLGPSYSEKWDTQNTSQKQTLKHSLTSLENAANIALPHGNGLTDLSDSVLESEEAVGCGPLLSRLLSGVFKNETIQSSNEYPQPPTPAPSTGIKEEEETTSLIEAPSPFNGQSYSLFDQIPQPGSGWPNNVSMDYKYLEERLKGELKYVGIYLNLPKDEGHQSGTNSGSQSNVGHTNADIDWVLNCEDDEVCAEIRSLQHVLRQATRRTQNRKKILQGEVKTRLAWQEYWSIKEDLDKQVDQVYVKRVRVPKKRKKHHLGIANSHQSVSHLAQQKAANSSLKALLDKRNKWTSKIGPLFADEKIMLRIPKQSIFSSMDDNEADGEGYGDAENEGEDDVFEGDKGDEL